MKKSYKRPQSQGQSVEYDEEPLEELRKIVGQRDERGAVETVKRLAANVHERGIRTAGERSLPLYGLVGFFAILALMAGVTSVVESIPSVIALPVLLLVLVLLVLAWIITPLLIYWDCKAAERYLSQKWYLGRLIAVGSILSPPIGLFAQLAYRIWKF